MHAGLEELQCLDVLDVHHNRVTSVEPLVHLTSLRILNLSANALTTLSDLAPLQCLAELNVRRNALSSLHFSPWAHEKAPPALPTAANAAGASGSTSSSPKDGTLGRTEEGDAQGMAPRLRQPAAHLPT
jgi:Leucine-rich repeat (LRR) protein